MKRKTKTIVAIIVCVLVVLPLIPLELWAVTEIWRYPDLLPVFGTNRLDRFLSSGWIKDPLINSILLSTLVTLFSLLLGFFPSKYLGTRRFKGRRFVKILIMLPALTPGIAVVFGMLPVFVKLGIYQTFWALLLAQVTFTLPYMIMMLSSMFENYDTDYEQQSYSLGVGRLDTLLYITLPSVKSGVAVGCMYTFIVSWSMYLLTSFYAPSGYVTMVTSLLPLAGGGTTAMQDVAITVILFFLPSLIVLLLTTLVIKNDTSNEKRIQI